MKQITFLSLLFFISIHSQAEIWLPSIISDNMVLQRESEATLWGWTTEVSEKILIIGSWNQKVIEVRANQGVWSVQLPTPKAGGPFQISIVGHQTKVIQNVLIGEVWVCSGQSNMEWTPRYGLDNAEAEIRNAHHPNIRLFTVPKHQAASPQEDTPGNWTSCSPETMQHFSSVAYFFGRDLQSELNIPIGLINTSWGGTPVETWIKKETLEANKELKIAATQLKRYDWWPSATGAAYNAMIHPLINFNIAGVIWYQGESNRINAFSYYQSFPLLIESWRKGWKQNFPFYFVQIAPFKYDSKTNLEAAIVRDAQLHTMNTVANTGMVVTNDIGNLKDIHPTNKQDVGKRLALWALAKTYGVKDLECSGPIYESIEINKQQAIIHFNHVAKGLTKKGERLKEFYIAGKDQQFHPAAAKIVGNSVIVYSEKVKKPLAVRFAFSETAEPNLFNSAGLPAAAFRTDDWEIDLKQ